MPTPSVGSNSWIGFGEESTWGTAAARTLFLEARRIGLKVEKNIGASRVARGLDPQRTFLQFEIARGDFEPEIMYRGMLKLWKHLLGNVVDTTLTATKSYRHEYARAALLPTGLSIEAEMDQQNFLFTGMNLGQAVIKCPADDYPSVVFSATGKTGTDNSGTRSTPTFVGDSPILASQAVLSIGGTDYSSECTSVEITIGNALDGERRRIGATTPKYPVRGKNRPDVMIKLDFEHSSTTKQLVSDFLGNTPRGFDLNYTGGVIGTSTDPYNFRIECPVCSVIESFPGVDDPGVLPLSVTLQAYSATAAQFARNSGQTGAIKITMANEDQNT